MQLKKLIPLVLITAAALALIAWVVVSFEFRSPMFAFLINWLVLSWVALMGQWVVFPLLPAGYYAIQPFEKSGQIYDWLGVPWFKKIVRRGPLTFFSPTLRFPAEKTAASLMNLENEMRKAETSHLAIFSLIFLLVGYALLRRWLDAAGWLLLFNILFNAYPVMLQRYNRLMIETLIRKG